MLAEPTAHDLSHSSEPTGAEPTFQPIATARAKTADEALRILADECNALADREEAMHTARGVFDATSPEYAAAGKAIDPVTDLLHMKWTMAKLVRPDTHAGLAAKARIYHSMRHALVGCVVDQAQPLLESIAEDVARLSGERPRELWASADAALIYTVNEAIRLSAENDAIWGAGPELPNDDPRQSDWHTKAKEASARYYTCLETLTAMKPITPAGMAARASVAPHLTLLWDEVRKTPEADLMLSISQDALRFGSALPAPTGDAALLSLGRYFEMQWHQEQVVIAQNGSDEAIRTEMDRTEDFVNRIRDLPATTPAGWQVKARAIAWTCSGDLSGECPPDVAMVASLLRDLGAIDGPKPTSPVLPDADRHLLALKRPFDEAWAVERATAAAVDSTGGSEALEAHERAGAATSALTRQIESFPATSLEGLKLKAAALSSLYPGEEITSECIAGRPGRGATDMRLIVQIIRDLRAMVDEPKVELPEQAATIGQQAA